MNEDYQLWQNVLGIGTIVVIVLFALFILAIRSQNESGKAVLGDTDHDDQSKGLSDDDVNRITLNVWSRRKVKKQPETDDRDWHGIAVFGPGVQLYLNEKQNNDNDGTL